MEELVRRVIEGYERAFARALAGEGSVDEVAEHLAAGYVMANPKRVASGDLEGFKEMMAGSLEYYIRNYRATGNPHVEPVECVLLSGSTAALSTVSSAKALVGFANKGLLEAKEIADRVKAGASIPVTPKDGISCERLLKVVRHAGYVADLVLLDPRKETSHQALQPTLLKRRG